MPEQSGPDHVPTARLRLARVLTAPAVAAAHPPGWPGGLTTPGQKSGQKSGQEPGRPEPGRPEGGRTGGPGGPGAIARLAAAGAFDPGRSGLRVLAVVAVVVVLSAAVLAWWSRPRPEPVAPRMTAPTEAAPGPTAPAELVVAVSGDVHEPGLVRLPPGARVADAIEAAGGLLPEADMDHLNLARKVADGELIAVGVPPPPGGPAGGGATAGTGVKINLNTATLAQLDTLPGIGPMLAQRIIDYRSERGRFESVGQLRQVSGIGEVRFGELRDRVTV